MRFVEPLILAGALVVAAPAIAQYNDAAPANAEVAPAPSDVNAAAAPTPAAPAPATDNAALAPEANATAANEAALAGGSDGGFPWGVLGLLGLIGLFGVRKVKG
jgi:hypothetical protein